MTDSEESLPHSEGAHCGTVLIDDVLVEGTCEGPISGTQSMLSFWGGYDPANGIVIDHHHPLCGETLRKRIFVLPKGKGSSTGSAVLLDALVSGNGPSGIILNEVDEIISLGVVIYQQFFGHSIPVVVVRDKALFSLLVTAKYAKIDTKTRLVFSLALRETGGLA